MSTQEQALQGMTKQQLLDFIASNNKPKGGSLLVKENVSGGIYIKDPSFVEYSTKKSKNYIAGINIGRETAKALFNNTALLEEIREQVNQITK